MEKKFINRFLVFVMPLLIVLVGVNYYGDAAQLFHDDYESKMCEIVGDGQFVTNIYNYDEGLLQKKIAHRMSESPDVLVLGSSRTMLINTTYCPDSVVFNSSVSGARLEDVIALYELYKLNNLLPDRLIIGLDPWFFNDNNGGIHQKSLENLYKEFNNQRIRKSSSIDKYKELLSLSYFVPSMKCFKRNFSNGYEPIGTMDKYNKTNTKLVDGSLVYSADFRNASLKDRRELMQNYVASDVYGIEGFDELSSRYWSEFESFVGCVADDGIEVEFFLSPYAPLVYEKMSTDYLKVLETEKRIKEYAYTHEIYVYGSYNPFILDFDENFFYDGMHCNEKAIRLLFEKKS